MYLYSYKSYSLNEVFTLEYNLDTHFGISQFNCLFMKDLS